MENKYDIRVNPPQWTEEKIDKHKDFEALMQRYERAPAAPNETGKTIDINRWLGIVLMAAVVSLLVWVGTKVLDDEVAGPTDLSTELALLKPMPQIQEVKKTAEVNVLKGDTLLAASGSRLIIPAEAFQDRSGNAVAGTVEIEYVEHSDFVGVFLSGAEMRAGKTEQLETAGLIEIQARQNGQTVYLKSDKAIRAELKTLLPADKADLAYEIQRYDFQEKGWSYESKGEKQVEESNSAVGKSSATTPQTNPNQPLERASDAELREAIAARIAKPKKPQAPEPANKDNLVLELDVKPEEFPELAKYGKILWKVNKADYKEDWDAIAWEDFDVKELDNGSYTLTLSTSKEQVQMPVKPVSPNAKINEKLYKEELKAYEQALAQRDETIDAQLRALKSSAVPPVADTAAAPAPAAHRWVVHLFDIPQLGLWGCNRLLERSPLQRRYDLQLPDGIEVQTVFMASADQNTVYRLKVDENGQVTVPITENKQVLWTVDAQNQLLRLPKDLPEEGERLSFEEKAVLPQTEEQLRRVLAFSS